MAESRRLHALEFRVLWPVHRSCGTTLKVVFPNMLSSHERMSCCAAVLVVFNRVSARRRIRVRVHLP